MPIANNLLDELDDEFVQKPVQDFQGTLFAPITTVPITDEAYDGKQHKAIHVDEFGMWESLNPSGMFESLKSANKPPAIFGQDIITIRALTGKARTKADQALKAAAIEFLSLASKECFWIPGNVASSKNNKDIGFYFKKNPLTGKLDKINILVDSPRTKKYKRATAGYWLQNKVEFLNQTRHLPVPLLIEFTFIRDSLRAFDFINACQVLADLMVENGYFPDDDTVHFLPVFNPVVYYNSDIPGVLIRVIK